MTSQPRASALLPTPRPARVPPAVRCLLPPSAVRPSAPPLRCGHRPPARPSFVLLAFRSGGLIDEALGDFGEALIGLLLLLERLLEQAGDLRAAKQVRPRPHRPV